MRGKRDVLPTQLKKQQEKEIHAIYLRKEHRARAKPPHHLRASAMQSDRTSLQSDEEKRFLQNFELLPRYSKPLIYFKKK